MTIFYLVPMKAVVLAAGYAVRLYPLTVDKPKPLLLVKNKPILRYILEQMEKIEELDEIFIVTNSRFYQHFSSWLQDNSFTKKITLLDDGTSDNEQRLGAVGDMNFAIRKGNIDTHCMVIAGDNLFGFSLRTLVDFFNEKKATITAFHDLKDTEKVRGRYGVGILNHSQILDFEEKPLQPRSTLAATACYIIHHRDLSLVQQSLLEKRADNPGDFIKFLLQHSPAHGFVFEEPWFDIGSFESLREAEEVYRR